MTVIQTHEIASYRHWGKSSTSGTGISYVSTIVTNVFHLSMADNRVYKKFNFLTFSTPDEECKQLL